jgi:hypothetical protein
VIDAQTVKTPTHLAGTSQVIDAGKKFKRRRRNLITDTLGLVPAAMVVAAPVHDPTAAKQVLTEPEAAHPNGTKARTEGGQQERMSHHRAAVAIGREVAERPPCSPVSPAAAAPDDPADRRPAECSTASPVRDHQTLPQRSRAVIRWAMAHSMSP